MFFVLCLFYDLIYGAIKWFVYFYAYRRLLAIERPQIGQFSIVGISEGIPWQCCIYTSKINIYDTVLLG